MGEEEMMVEQQQEQEEGDHDNEESTEGIIEAFEVGLPQQLHGLQPEREQDPAKEEDPDKTRIHV